MSRPALLGSLGRGTVWRPTEDSSGSVTSAMGKPKSRPSWRQSQACRLPPGAAGTSSRPCSRPAQSARSPRTRDNRPEAWSSASQWRRACACRPRASRSSAPRQRTRTQRGCERGRRSGAELGAHPGERAGGGTAEESGPGGGCA